MSLKDFRSARKYLAVFKTLFSCHNLHVSVLSCYNTLNLLQYYLKIHNFTLKISHHTKRRITVVRFAKRNYSSLFVIVLTMGLAFIGCSSGGGGGGGGGDDDGGGFCATTGPGSTPNSGGGTGNDPYIISLGVSYGGCAAAQEDPGPIYGIEVSAGTYTVTQTNGVTDLELWIYTESGTLIAVIDDFIGGFDESGTEFLSAGRYGIEVYNGGTQDSPFTLTITSP